MDMEKLLGKLDDRERRAWQEIEAARNAGASAEQLKEQRRGATETREQADDLRARLIHRRR